MLLDYAFLSSCQTSSELHIVRYGSAAEASIYVAFLLQFPSQVDMCGILVAIP